MVLNVPAVPNLSFALRTCWQRCHFVAHFLDYDDTIMAAAGQQAEQALADVMREYKGNYIVAVEGNAPLNEDGMFCILAGEPFLEKLKRVSADAKAIIAWGPAYHGAACRQPVPTQLKPRRFTS